MLRFEGASDDELVRIAECLSRAERQATVDLVACLAEIQRRDFLLLRGYRHLFDFCVRRLGMSEGAAGRRAAAARAVRKRMEVLSYLRDGSVSLSAICRIEPFLQEADGLDILARAARLDHLKLEEFVLELSARKRDSLRQAAELEPQASLTLPIGESLPVAAEPPAPDRIVTPSPGRVRISFEATSGLKEKLERTGTLLAHRLRTRRMEELIEALADLALRELDPARKTGRARPVKGNPRRVPWSVRKEVWERDGGRCAFTAQDGTRCAATRRLQYDHVTPWSLGGRSDDAGNIRLLCRAHNLRLGRAAFPVATRRALEARGGTAAPSA